MKKIILFIIISIFFSPKIYSQNQTLCNCSDSTYFKPRITPSLTDLIVYEEFKNDDWKFVNGEEGFDNIFLKNVYPGALTMFTYGDEIKLTYQNMLTFNFTPCEIKGNYVEVRGTFQNTSRFRNFNFNNFNNDPESYLNAFLQYTQIEKSKIISMANKSNLSFMDIEKIRDSLWNNNIGINDYVFEQLKIKEIANKDINEQSEKALNSFFSYYDDTYYDTSITVNSLEKELFEKNYSFSLQNSKIGVETNPQLMPSIDKSVNNNILILETYGYFYYSTKEDGGFSKRGFDSCLNPVNLGKSNLTINQINSAQIVDLSINNSSRQQIIVNSFKDFDNEHKITDFAGVLVFGKRNISSTLLYKKLEIEPIFDFFMFNNKVLYGSFFIQGEVNEKLNKINIKKENGDETSLNLKKLIRFIERMKLKNISVNRDTKGIQVKFVHYK